VVTEYIQRTAQHTAPITVEVERLSQAGIKELIKELVWNYRQLYLPAVEENEVTVEEYQRYERESDLAWFALEAAFKHRQEFSREFLRDKSDGAKARIADQLIRWTEDLEWPMSESSESGLWKSTARTAQECCEKTSVFMRDQFWPFTKIIR
jgi:hypothetical protein